MAHNHFGEDFGGHANENNLFTLGRSEGFPSQYAEGKTAVTEDVIEVALIYTFVTVALSFTIILLPACGEKARVFLLVRVVVGLFVGAILMTSIYGQAWEVGKTKGTVPYKAGKPDEVFAEIGVMIGLKSVNITLVANKPSGNLAHEKINYNERFSWTWDQGRIGFGPYAGRIQQEFRAAQRRGLPLPILWLAEYFTIDGEGFRFGRNFRTAGWYAFVSLWAAVPSWILANLLFTTVVRYGAIWASVTGLLQLLACLLWSQIKNPIPFEIPFNEGELTTKYGHCFWFTFSSGLICVFIGLTVILADLRFPDEVSVFFGRDPLSEYEECHLDPQEVDLMRTKAAKKWEDLVRQRKREEMIQMQASDEIAFDMAEMSHGSYDQTPGVNTLAPGTVPPLQPSELVLKRGSTVRRVQKSLIRTPAPVAPTNIPFYLPTYEEEY